MLQHVRENLIIHRSIEVREIHFENLLLKILLEKQFFLKLN